MMDNSILLVGTRIARLKKNSNVLTYKFIQLLKSPIKALKSADLHEAIKDLVETLFLKSGYCCTAQLLIWTIDCGFNRTSP